MSEEQNLPPGERQLRDLDPREHERILHALQSANAELNRARTALERGVAERRYSRPMRERFRRE